MPTLLSVDIWDTVIRRRCHPDEVKLASARLLWTLEQQRIAADIDSPWALLDKRIACEVAIANEREQAGFDNEYAIEEVVARWLDEVLDPRIKRGHKTALAEMLVLAEVEQEQRVVYRDERMARVLAHHKADRLVGLSDFYLGEKHLRKIVHRVSPELRSCRLYVSCDCLVNKMKGRLFAHVQRETGTTPHGHTHIGDNSWSDVESPRRFGVRAVHFYNEAEERIRARHRTRFEHRRKGDFVGTARLLTAQLRQQCCVPEGLDETQGQLYQIGFQAAPIYAALVLGAIEEAHSSGAEAVHYFTREGEFFKRVHEALAPERPFGLQTPEAKLLEVSRLVTFLPSLREVTTKEMMRLWNLYSTQSLGQLFKTLDVNPLPFEPLLKKHGLTLEPAIQYPWKDKRVQRLFADRLFVRLIEQQRDRRRVVAREYLRSCGFGNGPAVIVDVGWRGTIQDNIAHLFPDIPIAGWYLGLFAFLNEQPANVRKKTLGPDGNVDPHVLVQIIENVAPLEMLANTDTGSVRRYERAQDGSIRAVRVHDESEDAVWRKYTQFYQQGVLAAMPTIGRWFETFAVLPTEMKPMVVDLLRAIKAHPPRVLAQAYFELTHNETFGVGSFVDKRAAIDKKLLRAGERSQGKDKAFVEAIEATDWPQGVLRLLGRDELCRLYNAFREERARKIDARKARKQATNQPARNDTRRPETDAATTGKTRSKQADTTASGSMVEPKAGQQERRLAEV